MCGEGVCGECGGSTLHSTMLLAKLCGLQTGMNLVVRIMCPPYTVRQDHHSGCTRLSEYYYNVFTLCSQRGKVWPSYR